MLGSWGCTGGKQGNVSASGDEYLLCFQELLEAGNRNVCYQCLPSGFKLNFCFLLKFQANVHVFSQHKSKQLGWLFFLRGKESNFFVYYFFSIILHWKNDKN